MGVIPNFYFSQLLLVSESPTSTSPSFCKSLEDQLPLLSTSRVFDAPYLNFLMCGSKAWRGATHVLCATQPASTAPILCGNVFVVDHMVNEVNEQPGDLCGFRASGRSPVELGCDRSFNLVGYVSSPMHTRLWSQNLGVTGNAFVPSS